MKRAEAVLEFWFADVANDPRRTAARMPVWFGANPSWDDSIRERWSSLVQLAVDGELDSWGARPRPALALVLLLDQFPRNLFRGTAPAFANDAKALTLAREGIDVGFLSRLSPIEQVFFAMPYQHVENLPRQNEGVAVFEGIRERAPESWHEVLDGVVEFANKHRDLIKRFGRFPHRNEILGRPSTPEEARYLAEGGDTFGQGG